MQFFLSKVRKDPDRPEAMYQRAIESAPQDGRILGSYALFLDQVRKAPDRAEAMYERAIEADPQSDNTLANYAGFVLSFNGARQESGLRYLDRALQRLGSDDSSPASADCWFYALVHWPDQMQGRAIDELRRVLEAGARSNGWDFSARLAHAHAEKRVDLPWLEKLAAVISNGEDISTLNAWDRWNSTTP